MASVFIIPVGIAWRIPAYQMAASLVIYVVLQANRLYIKILGESILGNTLGNTGQTIFADGSAGGDDWNWRCGRITVWNIGKL